jgi:hypothetical protein
MAVMESMVERVARVLAHEERFMYEHNPERWNEAAIAAIEAMREPTKEMVEPGYTAIHDCIDFYNYDSGAGYSVEPMAAADVWRAMIDSILKGARETAEDRE